MAAPPNQQVLETLREHLRASGTGSAGDKAKAAEKILKHIDAVAERRQISTSSTPQALPISAIDSAYLATDNGVFKIPTRNEPSLLDSFPGSSGISASSPFSKGLPSASPLKNTSIPPMQTPKKKGGRGKKNVATPKQETPNRKAPPANATLSTPNRLSSAEVTAAGFITSAHTRPAGPSINYFQHFKLAEPPGVQKPATPPSTTVVYPEMPGTVHTIGTGTGSQGKKTQPFPPKGPPPPSPTPKPKPSTSNPPPAPKPKMSTPNPAKSMGLKPTPSQNTRSPAQPVANPRGPSGRRATDIIPQDVRNIYQDEPQKRQATPAPREARPSTKSGDNVEPRVTRSKTSKPE